MEQAKINHSIEAQCHSKTREHRVNIYKANFKPSAPLYLYSVANPKLRKSIEFVGALFKRTAFEKTGVLRPFVYCPGHPEVLCTLTMQITRMSKPPLRSGFATGVCGVSG